MKAKKENKIYQINTEQEKERYLKEGYDIYDDDGKVLTYSPLKKIAYSEYVQACNEINRLQALVMEQNAEIKTLKDAVEQMEAAPAQEKKAGAKKAGE